MKFTTRLLHGKSVRRYASGSTLPEIIQANAFRYDTAEEVERVFAHTAPGYSYSRLANPTVFAFEQRINDTEGGSSAVAFSSGMSAVFTAFFYKFFVFWRRDYCFFKIVRRDDLPF